MIAKNLFAKIRKTKGPILATINNRDDSFYIQVSKKDLIVQLSAAFKLSDETGFELDDNGYLSN